MPRALIVNECLGGPHDGTMVPVEAHIDRLIFPLPQWNSRESPDSEGRGGCGCVYLRTSPETFAYETGSGHHPIIAAES